MAKRIKKKTYSEFVAWLEGVECMQDENWTPSAAQWRTIRTALDNIKPDVVEVEVEVETPAPAGTARQPGPIQVIEPPTGFSQPPQPAPRPMEPQRLPAGMKQVAPAAPGVPAATTTRGDEVLDTSDGHYTSEFA